MILQTEHLSKAYGGRVLFHDVTFRLEEFDRLALVGPNGAGKTTLLNIISGEDDPDEGRVLFAKGARVGYLEQEAIEMGDLPVFEEVISSQTEVLEAERRLHKLEAELGGRFVRLHRAYLAAWDKIEAVDWRENKVRVGGRTCLLSRAGRAELKKKLGGSL